MNLPQKGRALHLYRCQQGSPLPPAGCHEIAPVEIYKPPCGAMQVAPQGGFIVRMGMLFRGGKATKRGYRFSRIVRANTRICGKRIPTDKAFPAWGRLRGGGFAAPKGSQPRLAALGSPFQGKGLAWTLPPSYGRRCPEGAEVGGG